MRNLAARSCWLAIAAAVLISGPAISADAAGDARAKPLDTLRWTTHSELECFGFDVYRSVAKSGPFRLVTTRPIGAAGTSDIPARYSFADPSVTPGQGYWYYVERIAMDGKRTRFSPIVFVPARSPAESATPEPAPASEHGVADHER